MDKNIFNRTKYYAKCYNLNYENEIRNKRWYPLVLHVMASKIGHLQSIYEDKGPFEWATSWRIPRTGSRIKPYMLKPHSRLKYFDLLWPGDVIEFLNKIPNIDLDNKLKHKALLNNDELRRMVIPGL